MSSEDAKQNANSPKYVAKQVTRRTLKSGVKTLRPMDLKPLPTRRPSQDARREWLLNAQPRRYFNTMIRNFKEIGKILGKVIDEENFVQVLADFLYRCPDGIAQVSKEAPPLPTSLPPDSLGTCTIDVDTEVLAKWDDGKYYKAIVEKKMKNGFLVRYKDYAEFKEITKDEIKEIEEPIKRNSFSVKETAKDLDYKFDQGLLAGAPSDRKSVMNASGEVATGKACAVSECTAFRMAGFPYCQEHQSALSLGVFDSSKVCVVANKAPKKSVFKGPIKPPAAGSKSHFATMPADMSKIVVESNKRQKVREEILSTERTYYKSIAIVMTSYVTPLRIRTSEDRNFLDPNKVSDLLSNWETLASFHQTFLHDLEMTDNIPKIFIKYAVYFKLYTHYLNGYDKCLQALDDLRSHKKFSVFMGEVSVNFRNQGKLDLMSYLIMPVQRVPRYVMLLRELKKHTPTDHPHSNELGEAIEKIADVAKHVNESKRKAENLSVLFRIFQKISGLNEREGLVLMQPYRQFIREGTMIESKGGGTFTTLKETTRIFYLFNDILLWTTEKNKYKGWLNLSASKIGHGPEKDGMQDWIEVKTSKICILFRAMSGTDETESWKVDLLKAIDRRNQLRREKMNKRRNRVVRRANQKKATLKVNDNNQAHSVIANGLANLKQMSEARASLSRNNSCSLISTSMSITVNDDSDGVGMHTPTGTHSPLVRSPIGHTMPSPLARSKSGLKLSPKTSPRQVKRRQMRSSGKVLDRPLAKNPLPQSTSDDSITEGPDQ